MIKEPAYRFSGYTDAWEQRKLGEISEKVKAKNTNNELSNVLTNSAEYGIIPQRDFFDKDIANSKNLNGYYVVLPDDFVYNPRISNSAPVGPIKRNTLGISGIMSPLYYVFRTSGIDNSYLAIYFDTTYWHKFMKLNGDSGARADRFAIKDSVFTEMPIPLPTLSEQTAIGNFFQTLDRSIALHQRKLDSLKEQKKTYLQKLFPRNGETIPEIRFPEFQNAPAWEQRKLGEIAEIRRGLTYKPSSVTEVGMRVLRSSNIDEDTFVIHEDDVFVDEKSINIAVVKENDILVTAANGSNRLVGKHALIKGIEGQAVHGGFMLLISTSQPEFLNASMSSTWYLNFINRNVSGGNGAIGNLSKKDLENELIHIPTLSEQTAIGNFFQTLDRSIAQHQTKLDKLKESKQTLLKKMFV